MVSDAVMARFLRHSRDAEQAGVVREGSVADYRRLARWHYRAGEPATVARVLCVEAGRRRELAGVLVVSMPALNGRWRSAAWPALLEDLSPRERAARLNAHVRTISRVVVDPRWRGQGLAVRLVRAYLGAPLTPATEALAAMGAVCPLFAMAGMAEYRLGPDRRMRRLRAALRRAGMSPLALLQAEVELPAEVLAALKRWGNDSAATRRLHGSALALAAGRALLAPPVAYAHGAGEWRPRAHGGLGAERVERGTEIKAPLASRASGHVARGTHGDCIRKPPRGGACAA